MWKTALFLIVTIIVIPFLAFRYDDPLTILQTDILGRLVTVYLVAAIACFLVSTISKNYSQVDKLWSIMPVVYLWMICVAADFEPRILMMAVLVSLWGIRLTYNFSRRGGYSLKFWEGEEDYRWPVLRSRSEFQKPWAWPLFNLFFISLYQMGLILLICLPALKGIKGHSLSPADFIIAATVILFLVAETVADQQQWNFHKRKKAGETKGFAETGLWSLVRHPNYASEQAIWIAFYFFSVSASGSWLNWSVIGAVLLVLLFYGSSNFSESISSSKYPDYSDYIKKTPRFVPFIK